MARRKLILITHAGIVGATGDLAPDEFQRIHTVIKAEPASNDGHSSELPAMPQHDDTQAANMDALFNVVRRPVSAIQSKERTSEELPAKLQPEQTEACITCRARHRKVRHSSRPTHSRIANL